jgi:putative CocE/NonD family hydrolase
MTATDADVPRSQVRVFRTVRIPMRDGIQLAATLYMPEVEGRYPALLEYLPYRKDDMSWADAGPHHYFAARGYVGVRLDVRGTGSSEGVTSDEYSMSEQRDAVDAIAWLAAQPWCTGGVGMFGISYGGFTALQAATHAPPALKAIIPMHASDDRYTDDCHYGGGALRDYDTGRYGNRMLGWNALPPDPEVVGPDWERIWIERLHGNEPWLLQWLRHQADGPYWRSGSVRPDYGRIRCPVFAIGGFRDGYVNAPLRLLRHCQVPVKVLLGPWPHQRPHVARPGPRIDWLHEAQRWWDHWLKGIDTGIMNEPAVTLYVQDYDPPRSVRDHTAGYWRAEPSWPPAGSQSLCFTLATSGRLLALEKDTVGPMVGESDEWDPIPPVAHVGLAGGIFSAGGVPFGLPLDQRADEAYSRVYTTAPLVAPIEIAGQPRLHVTVVSDTPVAILVAKLCDVAPDGTSALVTRSLLNLSHHRSHADPKPLRPSHPYAVDLEFDCTAWRFAVGHCIRLDLAASDWPTVWPAPHPAGLRVSRSTGRLELMALPPSIVSPPSFGAPPMLPTLADVQPETPRQELIMDQMDTRLTIRGRIGRTLSLPWGTTVQEYREMESILEPGEPTAASSLSSGSVSLRRPEITVDVKTALRVQTTPSFLQVHLQLDVRRDGQAFFHRTWEDTIERHGM